MIKFSKRNPLAFCWITVNVYALLAIACAYFMTWHGWSSQNSISSDVVRNFVNSSSKEEVIKATLLEVSATRGAFSQVFFILYTWLVVTFLNVFFTLAYFFRTNRNPVSK